MRRSNHFDVLFGAILFGIVGLTWPAELNGQVKSAPKCKAERRLKFKPILFGQGIGSSSHRYQATDGMKVDRTGEGYRSRARAGERLDERLKAAARVIERIAVYERGRKVGERAVAVFPPKESGEWVYSIMGTYEEVFWLIDAPSLCHALAFERQHER